MIQMKYRFPKWFYDSLPYLYLGSGLVVAIGLQNIWGSFSGLLFLLAGVMVLVKRWTHRSLPDAIDPTW